MSVQKLHEYATTNGISLEGITLGNATSTPDEVAAEILSSLQELEQINPEEENGNG